nr:GNAT family N-acetyltransferase [Shewanella sp. VB17]
MDLNCDVNGRPRCGGFINVETHFYTQGYIDSLYVHPDYQGKGVAYKLYEVLERWVGKQGYCALSVDASHGSKSLFLSCGFKLRHRSYQEKLGRVISGFLMDKKLSKSLDSW